MPTRSPQPVARFQGFRLGSAFQPIFGLNHRRVVGFEALVRAKTSTGVPVTPAELFQSAGDTSSALALDELCQQVHIANFAREAVPDRWLFLNISTPTLIHEHYRNEFLTQAMAQGGLACDRLVVEILEGAIDDESVLFDAVSHLRSLGALVALDDFGVGHSNFDRIWRLAPDIIKLDRSIIAEAAQHRAGPLRRMLPNLVALMHEVGSMVLIEGVETEDQALIALDADVDLVQGFYLGRPAAQMTAEAGLLPKLECLTRHFAQKAQINDCKEKQFLAPYKQAFRKAVAMLRLGCDPECACAGLLSMTRTARCYLLDAHGERVFHYEAAVGLDREDPRFTPVSDTSGGSWCGRPYFRAALNEARRLQVSRPYLSVIGSHICVTLSIANEEAPRRVFCCDVSW